VLAHAVFVAFARLEDLDRQGLDRVKVVWSEPPRGLTPEEYFEFDYFFETAELPHILL